MKQMVYIALSFTFLLPLAASSEPVLSRDEIEMILRLGDAFQNEAPWLRPREKRERTGEDQPQPPAYLSESPTGETRSEPFPPEPSICYDPITRRYYYCFPDYPTFYEPAPFPYFPHRWKYFWNCPPGFHWKPGRGCRREY